MAKSISMVLIIILFSICFFAGGVGSDSKKVIGWLEMVRIYPGNLKIRAKIDTGAKSSSLNVYNLKKFERGGDTWVSFELRERSEGKKAKRVTLERKVVKSVNIKSRGGGLEERTVIKMEICIAGIYKEIEMSVLDRSNFNYQILIGRTDLAKDFIVEPSIIFSHGPECKMPVKIAP